MRGWNDDPFTKKARKENFEARSVYKLDEIDRRERLLQGAKRVLDLGAAPGSWIQYCLRKLPEVKIIAVDLTAIQIKDPRLTFIQGSIEEVDFSAPDLLAGAKADVVLSDMAPRTSGIHDRDVALSTELAELALQTARKHLKPNGNFAVKLFMGDTFEGYHAQLKLAFTSVRVIRPESTRKQSREIFLIGKGFKEKA